MQRSKLLIMFASFTMFLCFVLPDEKHAKESDIPANVRKVPHGPKNFRPDPQHNKDKPYSPEKQLEIYGGKKPVKTARPLIELGRKQFYKGEYPKAFTFFEEKNPWMERFIIFGKVGAAIAYNQNELEEKQGTLAFLFTLELDLQFTSTERLHGSLRPLDKDKIRYTRWDFAGDNRSFETELDLNFDTLFFEGDIGAMLSSVFNKDFGFDMPIAMGLMPILFQNGIWLDDDFTGVAITIPALVFASLDISNADITFFAGLDEVDTQALPNNDKDAMIFGMAVFIEMMEGYWETGYAYTYDGGDDFGSDKASYHNATIAFTRRYFGLVSNSVRLIYNFGQDSDIDTADGFAILIENSFVTLLPSTLVPYANFFAGFNRPQKLAAGKVQTGILSNTGINFETDALTRFPKLDDSAADTLGGAIGVEYLFNLDQQIVLELAYLHVSDSDSPVQGDEFATGIRYQLPITNTTTLRFDAMYGVRQNNEDLVGVRFEVTRKF